MKNKTKNEMKNLTFKADDRYKKRLLKLQKKLEIDRSKVIRLAIDELFNTVMDPEKMPGDIVLTNGFHYRAFTQDQDRLRVSTDVMRFALDELEIFIMDTADRWRKIEDINFGRLARCREAYHQSLSILSEAGQENDNPKSKGSDDEDDRSSDEDDKKKA